MDVSHGQGHKKSRDSPPRLSSHGEAGTQDIWGSGPVGKIEPYAWEREMECVTVGTQERRKRAVAGWDSLPHLA